MSAAQIEIQAVAVVVAAACALPGVFLVLRRLALLSDAISHAILLGIVLGFFVTRDLSSPWLVAAATATGVVTVWLVALLQRTRLVREDAAIGLVFPLLFSVGVLLISRFAGQIHLDTDAVLLGELAFAPFDRFAPFGMDLGPRSLYVMGGIAVVNVLFITLFYKELKLSTFDPGLAAACGFSPVFLHYALTTLVSVTAVGAFDAVGSILVVALMIGPPATAYLLTRRLHRMLLLSALFGSAAALSGYWCAHLLDASIAGAMASMTGVIFVLTWMWAPHQGLWATARRRHRQRWTFAETMLAIHLLHHEGSPAADRECRLDSLPGHLRWAPDRVDAVVDRARRHGFVELREGMVWLTAAGRDLARRTMVR